MSMMDRAQGCLLGALIGDAAGATLEFLGRRPTEEDLERALAMSGGGVFRLAPGQITDDGELTLALAHALIDGEGDYDLDKVATRYKAWFDSGPFDIGGTTHSALSVRVHDGVSLGAAVAQRITGKLGVGLQVAHVVAGQRGLVGDGLGDVRLPCRACPRSAHWRPRRRI